MDERIVSEFRTKLEQIKREEATYSDPLDYIEHIAGFIKELMVAHDTNEIVLAMPTPTEVGDVESPEEILEEDGESDGLSPLEILANIETRIQDNKFVEWDEPYWIYKEPIGSIDGDFYYYNRNLWTYLLMVRIGIIDGELKFTRQKGQAEHQDDIYDNVGVESDWLKLGNLPIVEFWIELAELLLNCDDIWKFTAMYPQLHKLPVL